MIRPSAHSAPGSRRRPRTWSGFRAGPFQMGSDQHYPEERPVRRVSVDGFWIDRTPVTNESFARFVADTRHVTFAEIPPNPADYPGAKKELLHPGALVFVKPPNPVDLARLPELVEVRARRRLAPSARAELHAQGPRAASGRPGRVFRRGGVRRLGGQDAADRSRVGVCRARRARRRRVRVGQRAAASTTS